MSKSIIEDLYYGKCGNPEEFNLGKKYWDILHNISELEKILCESFDDKQKELFKEIDVLEGGLQGEVSIASFKEGLKIGIRLGIECMEEKKE